MERYLLGLYEKSMPSELSIPEKLRATGGAGFDYLELSVDETDEKLARLKWPYSTINSILDAEAETGIPIKSICLSGHRRFPLGHPDPAVQKRSLEIMADAISLASRLGVRIIQIAGYDVYYEPSSDRTRDIFALNLSKCVEMAAREGVILAFETMETEFINTVEKAISWVKNLNSVYLQIYPDLGNITNAAVQYSSDVLKDLESGKGHLAALHLKETKPGIYREVPYGEGHVDFPAAAALALRLGVRMFVGEFWYAKNSLWREVLVRNNEFLRESLKEGESRLLDCGDLSIRQSNISEIP